MEAVGKDVDGLRGQVVGQFGNDGDRVVHQLEFKPQLPRAPDEFAPFFFVDLAPLFHLAGRKAEGVISEGEHSRIMVTPRRYFPAVCSGASWALSGVAADFFDLDWESRIRKSGWFSFPSGFF